ncbi:MAG TPA: flagellar biosynthesis repressor FlbT [Devosia sp.]|nr:flagellar biosynthesis repressor FlbT [Devosia sp.]
MPLKVELKPNERLIIGSSLITNGNQRARLYIEGNEPILRQKDILTPETADTPAKHVYLSVQLMYLHEAGKTDELHAKYLEFANDFLKAAPSAQPFFDDINNEILTGSLYKALKATKRLMTYEQELLGIAKSSGSSLPTGSQTNS